jgi:hypothetical protein
MKLGTDSVIREMLVKTGRDTAIGNHADERKATTLA